MINVFNQINHLELIPDGLVPNINHYGGGRKHDQAVDGRGDGEVRITGLCIAW